MKLKTWVPCRTGFPVQTYLKSAHAENETSPKLLFSLVCKALSVLKDRTVETLPAFNYIKPYIDTTFLVVL